LIYSAFLFLASEEGEGRRKERQVDVASCSRDAVRRLIIIIT
jgi:hypothetical protein